MNFTKEWQPIEFLNYDSDEPLPLAEVIPFIFKDECKNSRASDMDGDHIMILYDLSLEFHDHLCKNVDIIYGIKEKNMVTICIIVNKNNNYLKYCKIVKSPITFLHLNIDILGLISSNLSFKDQLNLRAVCMTINKNISFHNYKESNFLQKLGSLIKECSVILNQKCPQRCTFKKVIDLLNEHDRIGNVSYDTNNFYSNLKATTINFNDEWRYEFESYVNFKILGISYTFKELLENIDIIMSLEFLIKLLDFDETLRRTNKSFTMKDKRLMKQHDLSSHFYKTNDCYFKFNKDLKQFFDSSEWFNVVKDIICGDRSLDYSLEELKSNISSTLSFGEEVQNNYDTIRQKLSRCKRFYHNEEKSRTYKYFDGF